VIELPSSSGKPDLFVHSPVSLDGPMLKAMEELGTVRYVCTPNYEHTKFASAWFQNYKEAEVWGCPGIEEKMPEIAWKGEIPSGYRPKDWKGRKSSYSEPRCWITPQNCYFSFCKLHHMHGFKRSPQRKSQRLNCRYKTDL
jgi:hypothetical protein